MNNILHRGLIAFSSAALLVTAGCIKNPFAKAEDGKQDKPEPAVPVEVAAIERGHIESLIRTSTHLEAESEVKVFARTANRITQVLVEEGDRVEQDALLVQLEDDLQRNQLEKARSNLDKVQEEFDRSKALFDQNLISEQAHTEIKFQLRQNELAFQDAQRELDYTRVRAPIRGTITRRMVKAGDLVNVNQHLFDMVDFNSIVARVYVPERELPRLAVSQPARVTSTSLPGRESTGYIQRIAPIVESKTGTVKVTVAFQEVGPLLPGMYVDVEIVTATRDTALLITKRALVYDGDQIFAYRLQTNRQVERLLIEPLIVDRDHVEPASGFEEGDLIVVAGQTGLKDGARVRLPGDPDPEKEKTAGETAADKQPEDSSGQASGDSDKAAQADSGEDQG